MAEISSMTDPRSFLGQGWAFPVADEGDGIALVRYEEDVRQAILIILQTDHHERVMRSDFGANLRALVFAPLNATTVSLARHQVEQALVLWEPRIDNVTVRACAVFGESKIDIQIGYRIRRTNTFYNLVYPFYVSEGREDTRV